VRSYAVVTAVVGGGEEAGRCSVAFHRIMSPRALGDVIFLVVITIIRERAGEGAERGTIQISIFTYGNAKNRRFRISPTWEIV
jgi:hypothetical protein